LDIETIIRKQKISIILDKDMLSIRERKVIEFLDDNFTELVIGDLYNNGHEIYKYSNNTLLYSYYVDSELRKLTNFDVSIPKIVKDYIKLKFGIEIKKVY
jgi:uncharacterized pyridoxamine 5'-phosphate oxidase family protein